MTLARVALVCLACVVPAITAGAAAAQAPRVTVSVLAWDPPEMALTSARRARAAAVTRVVAEPIEDEPPSWGYTLFVARRVADPDALGLDVLVFDLTAGGGAVHGERIAIEAGMAWLVRQTTFDGFVHGHRYALVIAPSSDAGPDPGSPMPPVVLARAVFRAVVRRHAPRSVAEAVGCALGNPRLPRLCARRDGCVLAPAPRCSGARDPEWEEAYGNGSLPCICYCPDEWRHCALRP